jgi:hexosaminidase
MIHLGGDEVDLDCYNTTGIHDFMKKHNIANYSELVVSHIARARAMLSKINSKKRALYWSNPDTFYQRYKEHDILMYWGEAERIKDLIKVYPNNSYVMAPVDYYYLDCSFGNKYGGESWCDPMKTFWRIYSFDPADYMENQFDHRMLGAEVPVWSEIMSAESFEAKVWPRAAGMADRLWGDRNTTKIDLIAMVQRQTSLAEYLTARGTPVGHNTGRFCEINIPRCFAYKTNKQEDALLE